MSQINIKNEADKTVIDIIGKEIGESWFDEGYSAAQFKEDINNAKNIEVNLNSLGGDVNDGLVMHDLLKLHPYDTTVNLLGANASASTVFAMGAKNVNISKNGLFLIHNAWTFAMGNSEELQKQAGELDKIDRILVEIYKSRTNKRRDEIKKQMAKEEWMTAEEAKDWGFADAIIDTNKQNNFNLKDMSKLGQLKEQFLNKIKPKSIMKDTFINKILDMPEIEMAENEVSLSKESIEKINNAFADNEKKINDAEVSLSETKANLETEIENLKRENESIKAQNSDLTEKLNKLEQTPSDPKDEADPIDEPKVNKDIQDFFEEHPKLKKLIKK